MGIELDLRHLNGYGIALINLIDAIQNHDEVEIKIHAQSIIQIANSHIEEDEQDDPKSA